MGIEPFPLYYKQYLGDQSLALLCHAPLGSPVPISVPRGLQQNDWHLISFSNHCDMW